MPYCRKCGAKLDEDARFCPVCGTPVPSVAPAEKSATPQRTSQHPRKTIFPLVGIVLIAILVISVVGVVIAFAPFQTVSFSQSNEATAGNVNTLNLVVEADVADVNVMMKDLPGNQRAAVNVSATGWRGIFGTDQPLALHFVESTNNSILLYHVEISRAESWSTFPPLDVVCNIYVDPSVDLNILLQTETGSIFMDASSEATFTQITLASQTGNIVASLNDDVVISGEVRLDTQTGSAMFSWNNTKVTRNISINIIAAAGSADLRITQTKPLTENVTLRAEGTTGSIDLTMTMQNDVGARISASTRGGINVDQQGFSSNHVPLQSDNYPGGSNFDVTLHSTVGEIDINVAYDLGGTRS
jgi:hypothetical protein